MWILKPVIIASALAVVFLTASSDQILKKNETWVCVKWKWSNGPFEGKVSCLEWAKKDCSNRLYPEICKRSG
jgi:hypothetical protein